MFKQPLVKDGRISVRCFARKEGNQFVAVCVDLCLAAQADDMETAKAKLHEQISDYIVDAVEHNELFTRPAPFHEWATYSFLWVVGKAKHHLDGFASVFREVRNSPLQQA